MTDTHLSTRATDLFGRSLSLRFVLVGVMNTGFSYFIFAALMAVGMAIPLASFLAL